MSHVVQGMKNHNGAEYNGEWKDDLQNGKGSYTYSNGDIYSGEWKGGQREGKGSYTYSTGEVLAGIWSENKFIGEEDN